MMDVKHFPIHIKKSELPEDTLKIVEKLHMNWKSDDVRFKVFTDGITNKLIGCYCVSDPNDIILVRVFGEKTDLYIDRAAEIKNFKLMNSRGYAPQLFATFDNGLVYDYIPGEVLNVHSCRDEAVYPLIAAMLAKMHKLDYGSDVPKVSCVWDKCECFIDLIPERYASADKNSRFIQHFPDGKQSFRKELEQLKKSLEKVTSPVVFCHNDLLLANVINCDNSVTFIDYEYAGYNYQAYDIANHFAEFAGVSDFDVSLYPSEEFQLDWIRLYLKEYEGSSETSEKSVRQLYAAVCKFTPVPHFFWAMWSLVQFHHSTIDFDYLEYAVLRYQEYKKFLKYLECS